MSDPPTLNDLVSHAEELSEKLGELSVEKIPAEPVQKYLNQSLDLVKKYHADLQRIRALLENEMDELDNIIEFVEKFIYDPPLPVDTETDYVRYKCYCWCHGLCRGHPWKRITNMDKCYCCDEPMKKYKFFGKSIFDDIDT